MVRIGTAGRAIAREFAACFPAQGSHLVRYAAEFNAVEINSSFHRPHRAATYARWARETSDGFRLSVKMPRAITYEARLNGVDASFAEFFGQCGALGDKLGCVLFQLPPSLAVAPTDFFDRLREHYHGAVVVEPRHPSWFAPEVEALLARHLIARGGRSARWPVCARGMAWIRILAAPWKPQDLLFELRRRFPPRTQQAFGPRRLGDFRQHAFGPRYAERIFPARPNARAANSRIAIVLSGNSSSTCIRLTSRSNVMPST